MLSKPSYLLLLLLAIPAFANDYGNITVSRITQVYDGDTFRVDIDQWPALIGKNAPIRVNNIDTPELRAKCPQEKRLALLAKQFTQRKLLGAKTVELKNLNRGKYFRITADVFIDGENLADSLLKAGFAKVYLPKNKKTSWCDTSTHV
ncbi:nuclease homologue [Colwellia chukchiensis]|uniref:Nuclease homologue n=2 Tax=Colwellia chukchiensis TaxID=641665 RepID=A0A1H7QNN0_9GAMM|nr:nuclease homologue [Colwellia chukchiensis]